MGNSNKAEFSFPSVNVANLNSQENSQTPHSSPLNNRQANSTVPPHKTPPVTPFSQAVRHSGSNGSRKPLDQRDALAIIGSDPRVVSLGKFREGQTRPYAS